MSHQDPLTKPHTASNEVSAEKLEFNAPIPVFKPLLEQEEFEACRKALDLGWLGMGSYVGQFEDALQRTIGADDRHIVAVSTGHAAIHLSLMLFGVGLGDEVITPSLNNIADFQAILATGATPVFCDIEDTTLCIDIDKAGALVTPRTKAVIAMDYACKLCDHDRINDFAATHGLRVLHDAAHSLGSAYKGRSIGSFADICTFSFDPIKTITCIDGGAIVVRSDEDRQRLHSMRLIGMGQPAEVMYTDARAWTYDVTELGFRYHLANLHAALGLAQLAKFDRIRAGRRRAAESYARRLTELDDIEAPSGFAGITPFTYYVRVPAERREALRRYLGNRGIETGIHWQPGHWFSLFKDCPKGDLTVTERAAREILTLPFHSVMSDETIDRVCTAIEDFFRS